MTVKESAPEMALFHVVDRKPEHIAKALVDVVEEITSNETGLSGCLQDARLVPDRLKAESKIPNGRVNGRMPSLRGIDGRLVEIQFGIDITKRQIFLSGNYESAADATRKTAHRLDELAGLYEEQESPKDTPNNPLNS